jgi:hypothetical protein
MPALHFLMPARCSRGVKIDESPNKDYRREYKAIRWLKEEGEADNELTPGEVHQ